MIALLLIQMKARKKASDAQSTNTNNTNSMNIGAYEDDTNDKQSRGRRQYTTKYQLAYTILQYVRKVLQVSTSSISTFISFLLIISSFILTSNDDTDNKQHQSTMISIGMAYLFIVKPILSTLYIVLCSSDIDGVSHSAESNGNATNLSQTTNLITTRIIALTFLLSIICNQFPKWLSALVACIAVFVFGLASRQLSSSTSHTDTSQTDQASATDNDRGNYSTTTVANRLQRVYTKLGLKERAGKSALVLFYYMNSCVQYTVSIIWLFYLNLFAFILLPLQTTCTNISYNHLPSFS